MLSPAEKREGPATESSEAAPAGLTREERNLAFKITIGTFVMVFAAVWILIPIFWGSNCECSCCASGGHFSDLTFHKDRLEYCAASSLTQVYLSLTATADFYRLRVEVYDFDSLSNPTSLLGPAVTTSLVQSMMAPTHFDIRVMDPAGVTFEMISNRIVNEEGGWAAVVINSNATTAFQAAASGASASASTFFPYLGAPSFSNIHPLQHQHTTGKEPLAW